MRHLALLLALIATFTTTSAIAQTDVTVPSDFIIGIDLDSPSSSPGGEPPAFAINNAFSKYLNFGNANSGFIVTPALGSSAYGTVITGFNLWTANDAEPRDPLTFSIWGTNDSITSANNSNGSLENWVPITLNQSITLPAARDNNPMLNVPFANTQAFKSYRVVFPTLKGVGATEMQIGEAELFGAALSGLNSVQNITAITPAVGPGNITGQNTTAGTPDTLRVDYTITASGPSSFQVRVVGVDGPESVRLELDVTNDVDWALTELALEATGATITSATSANFDENIAGDLVTFTNGQLLSGGSELFAIDLNIPGANSFDPVTGLPSFTFTLNVSPTAVPEPTTIAGWALLGFAAFGSVVLSRRVRRQRA